MKITKVTPRGFCCGVVNSIATVKKARSQYPDHEIIVIGWLVHNEHIIKMLQDLNVKTIDTKNKSRYDVIKSLKNHDKLIVVFSAHGTEQAAIDLAKEKKINFIDTTCIYVTKTHDIIKQKIAEGYEIFFIGKKNHPETISNLTINKKIKLIEKLEDIEKLIKDYQDKKIFVTNQTTISIYEFYELTKYMKKHFSNIEFKNDICDASNERQKAVIDLDNDVDLLIVVGDKRSNNSQKLVEIAKTKNIKSILISKVSDVEKIDFKNFNHIAITSGASTPSWLTKEIIGIIEQRAENE